MICDEPEQIDNMDTRTLILSILNEALRLDTDAIQKLFSYRVACNEDLANSPLPIVIGDYHPEGNPYTVSALGLLNGLFDPPICMIFDEEKKLVGFKTLEPSSE